MRETPILYSHKEMYQPPKPVEQKPIQAPPANPYMAMLYTCGEALV